MADRTTGTGDGPLAGRPGSRVSARWRIAGWITLTTALGLAALVLSTRTALEGQVVRDADADVLQHAEELRAHAAGPDPRTGAPFASTEQLLGGFVGSRSPGGDELLIGRDPATGATWSAVGSGLPSDAVEVLLGDPALAPRLLDDPSGAASSPLGPVRWVTTTVSAPDGRDGRFVAVEVLAEDLDEVAGTLRTVTALAVGAGAVTAAWAVVVAGQVLRPLRRWRTTVEDVGRGRLGTRIPVEGDDDLAVVARAVNEVLDRLQDSLDHEQLFVDEARREIAAPLAAARAALVDGAATQVVHPHVEEASAHLRRVDQVLDDLRDLASSRRPDFVRPVPVASAALASDLLRAAREQAPDRPVVLTDVADGVDVVVDPERVREAVLRLVANAGRVATPRGVIGLTVAVRPGPEGDPELRVGVTDDGPGLDVEQARHVYDRLAPAPADGDRGAAPRRGLGLPLVRAVAEAHGGVAFVQSSPGHGATFGLALPVDATAATTTAQRTETA